MHTNLAPAIADFPFLDLDADHVVFAPPAARSRRREALVGLRLKLMRPRASKRPGSASPRYFEPSIRVVGGIDRTLPAALR